MSADTRQSSRAQRLRHELIQYGILSLYLYICFGAIILYKMAVLRAYDIDYVLYGWAAIKALIVGKFIMLGHAVHLGERYRDKPLIYSIAYRVLLFAALVIALSFLEEFVKAWIHGKAIGQVLSGPGVWEELVTQCILLCLILAPYFGLRAISEALGPDRVYRMFFGGRQPAAGSDGGP